jgi:transcriptional regulator with XRE-family HTH domain
MKGKTAEEMSARLRECRGKLSRAEVADRLGIHQNTYGNYERGARVPDADFIVRFCQEFALSYEWLLTGKGPIRAEKKEVGNTMLNASCGWLKEMSRNDPDSFNATLLELIPLGLGDYIEKRGPKQEGKDKRDPLPTGKQANGQR